MSFKKQRSSEPPPQTMTSLPEDVVVDILARVPRFHYPTLSLVCKQFRSLVTSPELYTRRSLLGCTELCLYVILYNGAIDDNRWYILRRNPNGDRRLDLISSPHDAPGTESYVTAVGSRIYVFGGSEDGDDTTIFSSTALSIDCRSHTMQPLPSMPAAMACKAAGVMNGKVYVIGECDYKRRNAMVVFNTETQMWEHVMVERDIELGNTFMCDSVAMGDKMSARDRYRINSFVKKYADSAGKKYYM